MKAGDPFAAFEHLLHHPSAISYTVAVVVGVSRLWKTLDPTIARFLLHIERMHSINMGQNPWSGASTGSSGESPTSIDQEDTEKHDRSDSDHDDEDDEDDEDDDPPDDEPSASK